MFCCFVWAAGEQGPADPEALLADLREIAGRADSSRTQRFYLAKALYNRHHDAGDARDWARCDELLDELITLHLHLLLEIFSLHEDSSKSTRILVFMGSLLNKLLPCLHVIMVEASLFPANECY